MNLNYGNYVILVENCFIAFSYAVYVVVFNLIVREYSVPSIYKLIIIQFQLYIMMDESLDALIWAK